MKYLIEEDTLTAICDRVRDVTFTDKKYKPQEIPDALKGLKGYQNFYGPDVDIFGKWNPPEEYDDIESLPIYDDHDVMYLLFSLQAPYPQLCPLAVSCYQARTAVKYSVGRVRNKEFVPLCEETSVTINTGATSIYIDLQPYQDENDFVVVKIEATNGYFSRCQLTTFTNKFNIPNYNNKYLHILMRYGTMRAGVTLNFVNLFFRSDNVIDFAKLHQGTSTAISCSGAYSGNYSMQRWRHQGWNLAKNRVTSYASMFQNCNILSDIDDVNSVLDMSGWVSQYTTTVANMFNNCRSLHVNLNVSNWDLTACTTMSSAFQTMRSVKEIKGTETWRNGANLTTIGSMFTDCTELISDIDISNLGTSSKLTTVGTPFTTCYKIKNICMDNIDLTNVTSISTGTTTSAESISIKTDKKQTTYASSLTNITTGAGRLTYLDLSCYDFSNITKSGFYFSINGSYRLEDFYPPVNITVEVRAEDCNYLSHDSLMRIIDNLVTTTTAKNLKIGPLNIAKLTDDEIALATSKGWTVV